MASSGISWTFAELEQRANRTAHLLRALGLKRGDCVAALLENCLEYFEIAWAADRAGLYFVTIPSRLTASEAEYILLDSDARALFTSGEFCSIAREATQTIEAFPIIVATRSETGAPEGTVGWEAATASLPSVPIADESCGELMLYSSGSTGRPKGIKPSLPTTGILTPPLATPLLEKMLGICEGWTFLSPAPLYHAAPLAYSMVAQRIGCTVVIMEKFDEEEVLRAIETYSVDVAQFVPTHFIRLLKLPQNVRTKYDLGSLKTVVHAAAPCPVPVKEAMMEWLGPIIYEYYSGTEGVGFTFIGPDEWLAKKGSVGRPFGCGVHICDDDGRELPPYEPGQIFFSGGRRFEYHNNPSRTKEAFNSQGWASLDDVGFVDADGYLFLTDRKTFMIISGGVNIYPQEIENLLATHPKVFDVAVVGGPHADMGECVIAVVQLSAGIKPTTAVAEELKSFCRKSLSTVKIPRQFDFVEQLPREPTGKIFKQALRDSYWP